MTDHDGREVLRILGRIEGHQASTSAELHRLAAQLELNRADVVRHGVQLAEVDQRLRRVEKFTGELRSVRTDLEGLAKVLDRVEDDAELQKQIASTRTAWGKHWRALVAWTLAAVGSALAIWQYVATRIK